MDLETMCVVLDSGNSEELASFYQKLLGWQKFGQHPDEWIVLISNERVSGIMDGKPELVFQQVEHYMPPVWPATDGKPQQMLHLDFHVRDFEEGVKHALACGARLADVQMVESLRVFLDPAGHPFCILPPKYSPTGEYAG